MAPGITGVMDVNLQDLCEYGGKLYFLQAPKLDRRAIARSSKECWGALTGFPVGNKEPELEAMHGIRRGAKVSPQCMRGSVGNFLLEGGRLVLRSLLTFVPKGEIVLSDDWDIAFPDEHQWDWSRVGSFTDRMLEYTFRTPRLVPFERLRLYDEGFTVPDKEPGALLRAHEHWMRGGTPQHEIRSTDLCDSTLTAHGVCAVA